MRLLIILFLFIVNNTLYSQIGDNCSNAIVINKIPYLVYTDSVYKPQPLKCSDKINDYYGMKCLTHDYFKGKDFVFKFTPNRDMRLYVFLKSYRMYGGIAVLDGCPNDPNASCIGVDIYDGNMTGDIDTRYGLIVWNAQKDITYYIVFTTKSFNCADDNTIFELNRYYDYEPLPNTPLGCECAPNMGFEDGNMNGWTAYKGSGTGIWDGTKIIATVPGFQPSSTIVNGDLGLCGQIPTAGDVRFTATNGTGKDPNTDNVVSIVAPCGGNYSVRIGNQKSKIQSECLERSFTVTNDNVYFTYLYATVLDDPEDHQYKAKPKFTVSVKDASNNEIICGHYEMSSTGAQVNGYYRAQNPACYWSRIYYKNWTAVTTDLTPYIGQNVTVRACVMDCLESAHYGYAYFDTYCAKKQITGKSVCTTADSVVLEAPFGYALYQWFQGGTNGTYIGSGRKITIHNPVDFTVYSVLMTTDTYETTCFAQTITDTIRVLAVKIVPGDTAFCSTTSGNLTFTAVNGDPNTTFHWSSIPAGFSSTNKTITVPIPNITTRYIVEGNSPLGCISHDTVLIDLSGKPTITLTPNHITCLGLTNGSIQTTVTGGNTPYTYKWNNNATTANLSNLTAGTYTVTVTEHLGCSSTASVSITQPTSQVTLTTNSTNALCNGICNGTATATGNGGTGTLTYTWSNNSTTSQVTGLCGSTTYTVTVRDNNGCSATSNVTIQQPPALTLNITGVDPSGYVCDASATATASGGTSPLTYSWNHNAGNNTTANSLCPDTIYIITVTDANGCTKTGSFTPRYPSSIIITFTPTIPTCYELCNGSILAVAAGGNGNYTYKWNDGASQTTATAQNLCAGTYRVTVTDGTGVTAMAQHILTQPTELSLTSTNTNPSCNSICNGNITITATGGTTPYQYLWSNSSTNANNTNLCGNIQYSVTVTDNNGCSKTRAITLTEPPQLNLSIIPQNASCGLPNGAATANVTGGSGNYTYSWNTTVPQTTQIATGLLPGNYSVTVTDNSGCSITNTCTITNIAGPTLTITDSTDERCQGKCNGTATALATGGTTPYQYSWQNGITTAKNTSLCGGIYTVTVSDNNGCTATKSVQIHTLNPYSPEITASPTSGCPPLIINFCETGTDSTVLTYQWNFGNNTTGNTRCKTVTYNESGKYSVTVTVSDASGCTAQEIASNLIEVFQKPSTNMLINPTTTTILSPKIYFISTSSGVTNCIWDFGDASIDNQCQTSHIYSDTGTYQVKLIVTNSNNCIDTGFGTVIITTQSAIYIPSAFTPDGDSYNDIFYPFGVGLDTTYFNMTIYDRWGEIIFTTTKNAINNQQNGWDGKVNGKSPAENGAYTWLISYRDINGKTYIKSGKIILIK